MTSRRREDLLGKSGAGETHEFVERGIGQGVS